METEKNLFIIGEFSDQKLGEGLVRELAAKDIEAVVLKHEEVEKSIYALAVLREEDKEVAFNHYRVALGIPGPPPQIDKRWEKIKELSFGPLTKLFVFFSIALFVLTEFFDKDEKVLKLFLIAAPGDFSFELVKDGQWWRPISPVFLHFSFLHILFNLMWLKDLGSIVERSKGPSFFLWIFLVIGVTSNMAQYSFHGPMFGGMSGVVFGLLGYIYIHKLAHKDYEFEIPKKDFYFIIAWYVICLTGAVGAIANIAHGVGLVCGVFLGGFPLKNITWSRQLVLSILISTLLLFVTYLIEGSFL